MPWHEKCRRGITQIAQVNPRDVRAIKFLDVADICRTSMGQPIVCQMVVTFPPYTVPMDILRTYFGS